MKRFPRALSAACMTLVLTIPAAHAGGFAAINQSGNYNLTVVQQKGGQTKAVTKQIKPRKHGSTASTFAAKAAKARAGQSLFGGALNSITCGDGQGGNNVAVGQFGYGNSATAAQAGANNTVGVSQAGSNNASHTIQQGNNHAAYTTQTGNHNIAFVNQRC